MYGTPGAAVAGGAVDMVAAERGVEAVVETDAGAEMETIAQEDTEVDVETGDASSDGFDDGFYDVASADR